MATLHDEKEAPLPDPVTTWRASFPVSDAQTRLTDLQRTHADMAREIEQLLRDISLYGADISLYGAEPHEATPESPPRRVAPVDRPTGMDAVEAVLRDDARVWARVELNRELVRREWLAPGEVGRRTLGSILHRMVKRGRVVRVGPGRYALPAASQEVIAA